MAKESILTSDENRDVQLGIAVILGILGLAFYPLAALCGIAIIAVPFIITWAFGR